MNGSTTSPSRSRSTSTDSALQARAITHMLLDPNLQARVARDPEAMIQRLQFCGFGREIVMACLTLREELNNDEQFLKVAALGLCVVDGILSRLEHDSGEKPAAL